MANETILNKTQSKKTAVIGFLGTTLYQGFNDKALAFDGEFVLV